MEIPGMGHESCFDRSLTLGSMRIWIFLGDACDNLLDNIPTSGGAVDIQPLFFRLALDVITAFLYLGSQ